MGVHSQQPGARPGFRRRFLRWFIRAAVVVLLFVIVLASAAFWRLSRGPISLSPLVPRLEQALTDLVPPNAVTCSDVVLTWNGWRDPFDIRVADVALTAPENHEIARFETLGVNLDFPSLLRGELRPGAISLKGLHLTAVRDTDGKLSFQMGGKKTPDTGQSVDPTAWLRAWLDPEAEGPLQRLQRIQIVDASLEVTDKALGQTWGADGLTIDVERTPTGFDTSLKMSVALAANKTPLSAKASYAKADQSLQAHLEFTGLTPSDLADVTPSLEILGGIDLIADASIDVIMHKDWKIEVSAFEVVTAAGSLSGTVDASDPKKKITGTIEIHGLRPWVLASAVPQLIILSGIDIIVDGQAAFGLIDLEQLNVSTLQLGFSDRTLTASTPEARPRQAPGDVSAVGNLGSLTAKEVTVDLNSGDISGQISVENLNPSMLAQHLEVLKPVAVLRFPIDATVTADLLALRPHTVEFNIGVGGGFVDIPEPVAKAQAFAGATIKGRLDDLDTLTISHGSIDLGEGTVIDLKSTIDFTDRMVDIDGEANIASLAVEQIHDLWPPGLADGARTWISDHVPKGALKDIHVEVEVGDTDDGFGLRHLAGRFAYSDLRLELFPETPTIDRITGTASFSQSLFDFDLSGAQMNDLRVTKGDVIISGLDNPPMQLQVDATVEGPIATALALVNKPPLALVDPKIIDATDVSGNATTTIKLTLPLDGPTSGTVDTFNVDSQIRDFAWSKPIIGPPLTKGRFSLKVTPSRLTVGGDCNLGDAQFTIDLNEYFSDNDLLRKVIAQGNLDREALQELGLPKTDYLEGMIGVDVTYATDRKGTTTVDGKFNLERSEIRIPEIDWHKPEGTAGLLTASATTVPDGGWLIAPISLTADGLDAAARMALTESPLALSFCNLIRFQHGRNDFSGHATALSGGGFEIQVEGASLDLEPVLTSITDRPASKPEAATKKINVPPVKIEIDFDKVLSKDQMELSRLVADIWYDGTSLNNATISAGIGSAGQLSIATNIVSGHRTAKVKVDGVGVILSILHLTEGFEGGTLTLDGSAADPGGPVTGHLLMQDLKITKAPVFAQLLRAASMEGLLSSFTSTGLKVNRVQSELEFEDPHLKFNKLTVLADGVGITADGAIDFGAKTVDLKGFLTPAATIQRVIGKIPLLGKILTGVNREGIIATEYSITGPLGEPAVQAKPLSILTPGITRDLLRFKSVDTDATPTPGD